MENAKQEFLRAIKGRKLVCARVGLDRINFGASIKWSILKDGYSEKDYEKFIKSLDFDYDSGYGSQELFGKILFEDSYADRGEYDGSEWWEFHRMPTIDEVVTIATKDETN